MTTIVVVRKGNQIAIGGDTLTTFHNLKANATHIANHSKLTQVGDGYIAVSGSAAWKQVLANYIARMDKPPDFRSSQDIFDFMRIMHKNLVRDYHLNETPTSDGVPFEQTKWLALVANQHGIFGIDSQRYAQEYTRFHAMGSGMDFAIGAMWAVYEQSADAEAVARVGLLAGCEYDTGTGSPIEIKTFTYDPLPPEPFQRRRRKRWWERLLWWRRV